MSFVKKQLKTTLTKVSGLKTEKMTAVRSMPFFLLAEQTIFSIRTLKLFLPDVKVEIHTNHPNYHRFKWLENEHENIKTIDRRKDYDKIKKLPFWCYRIRYTTLKDIDSDVVMIDGDTYFHEKPQIAMSKDICWISEKHNMGILGLTKENCHRLIPGIIGQINNEADPEGKEKRAIDEIITLGTMEREGIKVIETGKWIRHYFNDESLKWSMPTETLFQKLEAKAKGYVTPDELKEYTDKKTKQKKWVVPWINKWEELRENSKINIIALLHEFDDFTAEAKKNIKK